ncbi:fluoride efflux transporter FluC [Saccharomonospora iraqiensis]|uniref:fluoride efflux transporter FluC n=1 Tax=Saccharomonospora iraqiensis TaxID=52698 RepID=UPI00022E539E
MDGMVGTHHRDVLLVIAAGGALGSLARYGLTLALPYPTGGFAGATLTANVVGCLLIGVLTELLTRRAGAPRLVRPFLGIGVLGGFTTLSTYVLDTLDTAAAGRPVLAVVYAAGSLAASLAAVVAGTLVTRAALRPRPRRGGGGERDAEEL